MAKKATDVSEYFTNNETTTKKRKATDVSEYFVTEEDLKTFYDSFQARVDYWAEERDNFFKKTNDYYTNRDPSSFGLDSSTRWKESATNKQSWLQEEAEYLGSILDTYGYYFDSKTADSLRKAFSETNTAGSKVLKQADDDISFWNQFKDEGEYQNYYFTNKYDGKSYTDVLKAIESATGNEKDWLSKNSQYYMSSKEAQAEIDRLTKEDADYQAAKTEADTLYRELKEYYIDAGYSYVMAEDMAAADPRVIKRRGNLKGYDSEGNAHRIAELTEIKGQATLKENKKTLEAEAKSDKDYNHYAALGESKGLEIENKWFEKNDSGGITVFGRGYADEIVGKRNGKVVIAGTDADWFAQHMTDEQYNNYVYFLGKYGEDKAKEYLSTIEYELNTKRALDIQKSLEGTVILPQLFGFYAGLDSFGENLEGLFSDGYKSPSATQIASGLVREDQGTIGKVTYDLANTTGHMMPSILGSYFASMLIGPAGFGLAGASTAGTVGQGIGAGLTGISAMGGARQEMLNLGYSEAQANTYGFLTGASEACLQYALGGIGKLGGAWTDDAVKALTKGINSAGAKFAIEFGADMASEALEEGLQEVLNPFFQKIATGKNEGVDWEQVGYSGLLGALSAGLLNGLGSGARRAGEVSLAKQIKKDGNVAKLKEIGNTFSADTLAYKLASKVDENTGAGKLATLIHEMRGTLTEQNTADIKNQLVRSGMVESDADTIAKWLAKAVDGDYLNATQRKALDNNPIISRVFKEVIIDQNSTVNQRLQAFMDLEGTGGHAGIDYSEIAKSQSKEAITDRINFRNALESAKTDAVKQKYGIGKTSLGSTDSTIDGMVADAKKAMSSAKVSESGVTTDSTTGKQISIKKVKSNDGKQMTYELANGSVIDSKNVEYSSEDEGILHEHMLEMGYDANIANAIINGRSAVADMPMLTYINGVDEAIEYGKIGYPMEKISSNGFYAELPNSMKTYAYNLGKDMAKKETESAQARVDSVKGKVDTAKEGKVIIPSKATLTERQRTSIETLGKVVSDVTHNKVVFFNTEKRGNTIVFAEDVAGHKAGTKAPNGFYDRGTGTIYIDLNAGQNGEGVILWTAAHELTHFVRQWSPAKFKVLADFLMEEYGKKGVDIEALIDNKIAEAKAQNKTLTRDKAYEEVIADSMQMMFTDTNLAYKLEKLKNTDKGLWNKIKEFFRDLFKKINVAYKGLDPQTEEAKLVHEMGETIEKISDLFAEAIVDAGNTFANAEAMVAGEVDINGDPSSRDMSLRSVVEGSGLYFDFNEKTGEIRVLEEKGGVEVTSVNEEQIKDSPLGNIVTLAVENKFLTKSEAKVQYKFLSDLVNLCLNYKENFTMVWEIAGTQVFSAIKANSDTQYGKTIDFSTVCKKTQQVINVISETQKKLKRGLTKDEIKNIVYYETGKAGEPTPCPVCYVFSRWMGIGGILQQMSDFQKKYDGVGEAEMRDFINDVESEIISYANTPGKSGKVKPQFFDKNGKVKYGTVIADLKAKANNKIKSADIRLKIQETETLLAKADVKDKAKLQKTLDRLKKKLDKDGDILDAKLKDAEALLSRYEEYQWLTKTYMDEVKAEDGSHIGWKLDPNFKPVADDVLWDLREGARFATEYPKSWIYRTTKGCNAGKAILPYSDARVGETIQGVAYSNVKDIIVGEGNAFLNGDVNAQRDYVTKAIKKQLAQNLIGGMRYQSTSDFRYEYGSDYLITFLEMQAIGAKVQLYTKVIEAVDFLCSVGAEVNLSVMPLNDGYVTLEDGRKQLVFSSVTGINAEAAIAKTKQYDNAQLILVGISDEHIRLALEGDDVNGDVVTFVIPFHGSGNTVKAIQELMDLLGEDLDVTKAQDYSLVQTDHFAKNRTAEQVALWDLRKKIISRSYSKNGKNVAWDGVLTTAEEALLNSENGSKFLKDLYNRFYVDRTADEYGVSLSTAQAEQIFPYEYWDKSLTYAEADRNGERFKEYCATMGIVPRFSGVDSSGKALGYGNFTNTKGYWKLLIDRKMYNNDGTYHSPKKINVTDFKVETLDPAWGSATYGDVMQKDTNPKKTNAITENVIRQIEKKASAEDSLDYSLRSKDFDENPRSDRKDETDNLTFSMRNSVEETKDLLAIHNTNANKLLDAIVREGLLMPSVAITNKSFTDFGDISLVLLKDAIDPKIRNAVKLFGADAWTPTQTPIKKNARFDPNKTTRTVNTIKNRIGSKYISQLFDITPKEFKEAIIKADGDIFGAFAYDIGMQTAYAKEKGLLEKIPVSNGKVDVMALKNELNKNISGHDRAWGAYKQWLYGVSDDIITDYNTATNTDILNNMLSQPASNKPFKLSMNGDLIVPASEYKTVEELRKNKNRLSENAEREHKKVANKFLSLAERIAHLTKRTTEDVVNAINTSFERRYDAKGIANAFSEAGIGIPNTMAKELQNLYKEAVELPTLYFEAKPQDKVGIDQIAYAVIPNNTDIELKNLLTENGIKFIEYEEGNKNSRLEALNSNKDIMFSDRTSNATDNRSLLANALETVAKNDVERSWLSQYKAKIESLNKDQNELSKLRAEIKKARFTKGADRSQLSALENKAKILADRINKADKKLLNLEASKPLQSVVERERAKAYKLGKEKLAEYREQRAISSALNYYRPRMEKIVGDLQNRLEHPSAKTAIPEAFGASIAKALSAFNFTTYDKDGNPRPSKANMSREEARESLKTLAKQLEQNSIESQYGQLDIPAEMLEWIESVKDYFDSAVYRVGQAGELAINKMDAEQLKTTYKFLRSLQTAINKAGKYYTNASYNVADDARSSIDYVGKLPKEVHEKVQKALKVFKWDFASPVTVFDRFGEGGQHVYNMLVKGQSKMAYNSQAIIDFVDNAYTAKEAKEWRETLTTVTIGGKDYNVPVEMLMGLHCLLKQEDSRRHILEGGGIRFADVKHKGKVTRFENVFFNEIDAMAVEKALDAFPRARECAEAMQKFMQEQGSSWGNEISMVRYGYHAFTKELYYPIRTVAAGSEYEAQQKRANIYALLNKSFTKERTPGANNAVIVDGIFSVFNNHMSEMALYNAWALPVIDTIKWFNYKETQDIDAKVSEKSVHETLRLAYGNHADEYVRRLLESINSQTDNGLAEEWAFLNLRKVNRVAVSWNIRVAIQQPFSITRAMELINPKYITPLVGKAYTEAREEMLANSGIAKWKSLGYYDADVSKPMEARVLKNETFIDKTSDVGMKGAEIGDSLTWTTLWNACKKETAEKNPELEGKALLEKTTERFDDIVLRTQVVDSVLTKPQWLRSKGFWHKSTSAFMSEPLTSYNALLRQADKFSRDQAVHGGKYAVKNNAKNIVRATGVFLLTQLVNAIATAPIDGLRDDDDYETYLEKVLASFKENALMNILPTSLLPYVSDIVEYMMYGRTDRADMSLWVGGIDLGKQIWNLFDPDKYSYHKLHKTFNSMLKVGSQLSGFPVSNVFRDVISVYNTIAGAFGYGELKFQTAEDSHSEGYKGMYEAMLDGNEDRMGYLYGQLLSNGVEEDKVYNGLTKLVREDVESGKITDEEAAERLKKIIDYLGKTDSDGNPITDNDIHWMIDKWHYAEENGSTEGYSKYDDVIVAMEEGNPSTAIAEHVERLTAHYLELAQAEAEKEGTTFNEKKARKEAESKANSAVKSAITSYWKPLYKEAYKNKDDEEMKRIRYMLRDTKLYGSTSDVLDTVKGWLKS